MPLGISGPDVDPSAWALAVLAPREASAWLTEVGNLAARWPLVRVVRTARADVATHGGCGRPGYYLVRPDGHIAAHGHERDLNRLEAELGSALLPRT